MIKVNKKKSITLKNRTNYFIPTKDKVKVTFSSPDSYQSRQIKIEGYETRLYYQYKHCEDLGGQTFFYTLTYNDAHMPKHYGMNCFDYEDLRDLLTGGFRKQLLRKYGTTFKYFIGAELGDGKGSRGMHNNPHYHILFFLEPNQGNSYEYTEYQDVQVGTYKYNSKFHKAGDPKYKSKKVKVSVPYKPITSQEFRHLVRMYWQGFDEDTDGFRDYNEARYGIAREGENIGKVTDFRACSYVAKYVCKDVKLKSNEDQVRRNARWNLIRKYEKNSVDDSLWRDFFYKVIMPMYNTPLNAKRTKWSFTDVELIQRLTPKAFDEHYMILPWLDEDPIPQNMDDEPMMPYVFDIIKTEHLWDEFHKFKAEWYEPLINEKVNEWRNRFSNKCRISQGVGESALSTIDPLDPYVQVPSKHGFKNRPIPMYYYRKLYMDVVKDPKGNNLYILNQLGIDYKVNNLPKQMEKMTSKLLPKLDKLIESRELYDRMYKSDINVSVTFSYDYFLRKLDYLLKENNKQQILDRYAEYKLVYENRFFAYQSPECYNVDGFPLIDAISDYRKFLVPSYYSVSRNDLMLDSFIENPPSDCMPYQSHPYFLRFLSIFSVLDMCADYFFIQGDDKKQQEAEDRAAVKRFHDRQKLVQFYQRFSV